MERLAFLAKSGPGFALHGSQIKVLSEPSAFYNELCSRAASARRRIVLASLYLGTGKLERQLVDSMMSSLQKQQGRLRVHLLLDFCRGNRLVNGQNSCSLVRPLLTQFQDSVELSLYHTPKLRGLFKSFMPHRYNETIGLQHCKVYLFDDSLIISGANLSQDYFTDRQDRYVIIENCAPLADFYEQLVQTIASFSFQARLDPSSQKFSFEMKPSSQWPGGHPYLGSETHFVQQMQQRVERFWNEACERYRCDMPRQGDRMDTRVFPTLQIGFANIKHDSQMTSDVLRHGAPDDHFKMATGYFNLTRDYMDLILHHSQAQFQLLMAHPKANSFYRAPGLAGGIPHAYTHIARQFFDSVASHGAQKRISLHEYRRPQWTFHAKGLWWYLAGQELPSLTLTGSPNFGLRSVERDLESQVAIVTSNNQLAQQLHKEHEHIFKGASSVTRETFCSDPERKVPTWVKIVVALARHFF